MTQKQGGNPPSPDRTLDLVIRVFGVLGTLTALFGFFFPDPTQLQLRIIAFTVTLALLAVVGLAFVYRLRRAARLHVPEPPQPLSPSAALRGLLPFEDGDPLPGRGRDLQELYTLVSSSTFRFGVLWGESGAGKTSLLRAGLVPTLRQNGFLPIYILKPTEDPLSALRSVLDQESPQLKDKNDDSLLPALRTLAPKGKKVVVVFDQFEDFFVFNRTPSSRAPFARWLAAAVADPSLPVAFLVGIRADFFAQLQSLGPDIPEPTSLRTSYQLQNFEPLQAKQILTVAAKEDAVPFQPALVDAVVRDLTLEGFVRPAELQIVGTRLKRKNIFNANQYEIAGRARGILSSFVNDEVKLSANAQITRLILKMMTTEVVVRSPTDLSIDDILSGISGAQPESPAAVPAQDVQKILDQLVADRIVIRTDDGKYNLVHDYLAPYVRAATEGVETNPERANRLLRRYVAEYNEDPRTRIPLRHLREIQAYAGAEAKAADPAKELLAKSERVFLVGVIGLLAVPVLALLVAGALYIYLANSYYLSTTPVGSDMSYWHIVVRSGSPRWASLPALGQVMADTDFVVGDLDQNPATRDNVVGGRITGVSFNRGADGRDAWGASLTDQLGLAAQLFALRTQGQAPRALGRALPAGLDEFGASPDPKSDERIRNEVSALALLHPEAITSDLAHSYTISATQSASDIGDGPNTLRAMTLGNPQAFDSDAARRLVARISTSWLDEEIAVNQLALYSPQVFTPDMIQSLVMVAEDSKQKQDKRLGVVKIIAALAQSNPEVITPTIAQFLLNLSNDYQTLGFTRGTALDAYAQFAFAQPALITPERMQMWVEGLPIMSGFITDTAPRSLGTMARVRPALVTPALMQKLVDNLLLRSSSAEIADSIGEFAHANPSATTIAQTESLIAFLNKSGPGQDALRTGIPIARALADICQVNPCLDSPVASEAFDAVIGLGHSLVPENYRESKEIAQVVGQLARARPNLLTSRAAQDLEQLSPRMADKVAPYGQLRILATVRPQAFSPDIRQMLIKRVSDPSQSDYDRIYAAFVLSELAQYDPEAAPPVVASTIADIIDEFMSPKGSKDRLSEAILTLGALGRGKDPKTTTLVIQSLLRLVWDVTTDSNLRIQSAQALGELGRSRPDLVTPDLEVQVFQLLLADQDQVGRVAAAYALFLLGIDNPKAKQEIQDELTKIISGPQPDRVIAAARASEMITLGEWADAAREHPEKRVWIVAKLDELQNSSEPQLAFAAKTALEELGEPAAN